MYCKLCICCEWTSKGVKVRRLIQRQVKRENFRLKFIKHGTLVRIRHMKEIESGLFNCLADEMLREGCIWLLYHFAKFCSTGFFRDFTSSFHNLQFALRKHDIQNIDAMPVNRSPRLHILENRAKKTPQECSKVMCV